MKLTSKEEDYLETIYRLSRETDTVGVSDVARERGVTLPTVISAINRLKDNGMVSQRHYGKIFLSQTGLEKAEEVYRIHSALKLFLTDVLCLPAELSEKEACRLEHAISNQTITRLVSFIESYQACPVKDDTCHDKYISEINKNKNSNATGQYSDT